MGYLLKMKHNKIRKLHDRLAKLGIETTYVGNYPWIYIETINGKRVSERFRGNHGFTVVFEATHVDGTDSYTDISEIFKLIRKYCDESSK